MICSIYTHNRSAIDFPISTASHGLCKVSFAATQILKSMSRFRIANSISRFSIRHIEAYPRLAGALMLSAIFGIIFLMTSYLREYFTYPTIKPSENKGKSTELNLDGYNKMLAENVENHKKVKKFIEASDGKITEIKLKVGNSKKTEALLIVVGYSLKNGQKRTWIFPYTDLNSLAQAPIKQAADLLKLYPAFKDQNGTLLKFEDISDLDKSVLPTLPKLVGVLIP
jgi:hypothetical protein